ncbi:MAG: MBOAT family O-acyltransferase, partial [Oscillospiraceae bacterium]|nr:MBOAT family O-acyltransferase [Oscillospiraceae bacterium]
IPAKLTLALPAGISFYTFTVVGYAVDVYHKKLEPEKDFVTYALFVSFFPSVLMGPIARAGEMLPQYKAEHKFEYGNLVEGLQRFLTGAFKKVVIADGLGVIVDAVYGSLADYRGPMLLTAVVFYAVQLYADFSGYTDMALGAAKVLGFTLRENFKAPYLAATLGGFWSRWHSSLTDWLRDYIYIPLGGSRRGFARKLCNILIVFLISGLWHGAGWTFVVWGLWLGVWRVVEELARRAFNVGKAGYARRGARALSHVFTLAVVSVGWIFFRSASLAGAGYVLKNIFCFGGAAGYLPQLLSIAENGVADSGVYYLFYFGSLAFGLWLLFNFDRKTARGEANPLASYKSGARWALYHVLSLLTILFYFLTATGAAGPQSFLYNGF